ncbi:large conductance mechanosensitive channel protein [Microdochium trichocladiopsis]|uniref:Large conductance mechanosensitive channel protein n=1 Tax=Microdochium trichocladiopsis TaxID=1682393 RepID=A0A9P8YBK5_9PEZI|nr:large conductance mechanosensitive channel protein [Microdochium trichocladiopsis]KAH7035483.1 large conductance mechanosensitive channel protein [Microdochium trichocladiopsis]
MPPSFGRGDSSSLATDNGHYQHDEERTALLQTGQRRFKRFFSGFVDFAFSGNVLDVAFGLILASAFTTVTTSLVNDILLPPISVIFPLDRNMQEKFAVLKPGPRYEEMGGYTTIEQAVTDGAVILAYGKFLAHVINFLSMGFALYGIAAIYQKASKEPMIRRQMKCRYCRKWINEKALRCVNCSSWQDGREDLVH